MMNRPATFILSGASLAAALALGACEPAEVGSGPTAPKPAPAPAPAAANMDISQPITARGTEPFWALHITDGSTFRLTRPEQPDLTGKAPGATVEPGRAVWVAQMADGRQMTVTLYRSECSDGMSDIRYPMSAEVVLPNERLSGCAAPSGALKQGG